MSAPPTTVSAADLLPSAFSGDGEATSASLRFDLRRMACFDSHACDQESLKADEEGYLLRGASRCVQQLVGQLWALPQSASDLGAEAVLPSAAETLPRKAAPPARKAETVWEKFAREKGIVKRKKSRMVLDETTGEYMPAWGYKRANAGPEEWGIVEVKGNDDPEADPWTEARQKKRARIAKNALQQMRNQERAAGGAGMLMSGVHKAERSAASSASDLGLQAGIPGDLTRSKVGSGGAGLKKGKKNTHAALQLAKSATASMGAFDPKAQIDAAGGKKAGRGGGPRGLAAVAKQRKLSQRGSMSAAPDREGAQAESSSALQVLRSVVTRKEKKDLGDSGKRALDRQDLGFYDAVEGEKGGLKRKKGRGAAGKMKKLTRKQTRAMK